MKYCPNCGTQAEDQVSFCPNCGFNYRAQQANVGNMQNIYDHTAEFDAKDISDNKVLAMLPYLLGTIGIIVALLAIGQSKYVSFHVKQALKFTVLKVLLGIVSAVLCWTFIVPIAGVVCAVILMVLQIIAFFQICAGKAVEPAIVRDLSFLR